MRPDPIGLAVFQHLFSSVAEEMGGALERTAYSPNIKERRDYSCAVFDARGGLVAQAAHIPVHLGAFPLMMAEVVPQFEWCPGDTVICNDPFIGGTHLPDVSLVTPVFDPAGPELVGFVASRAHHADIGGAFPGSMASTTEILQEGIIIPPIRLVSQGEMRQDILSLICRNVRTGQERMGDFAAQLSANETGRARLAAMLVRYGAAEVRERMHESQAAGERAVRALLADLSPGCWRFEDSLDEDGHGSGPLHIRVCVTPLVDRIQFDFTGTAPQCRGSVNATLAVTHAAVYYCILCLLSEDSPINQGCFRPIEILAPGSSLVNARSPAAVAAGNVETSQRIVDVVLGALAQALPERIPAASQGTMNNLSIGGRLPDSSDPWAYYETAGGGAGAGHAASGISAAHCHMSNTRNTPVEALEYHYPLRVWRYSIRDGSGGEGTWRGGDGLVREVEVTSEAVVTIVADRRVGRPYGLSGAEAGMAGFDEVCPPGDVWQSLPAKGSQRLPAGGRIRLNTPGGGGWGASGD